MADKSKAAFDYLYRFASVYHQSTSVGVGGTVNIIPNLGGANAWVSLIVIQTDTAVQITIEETTGNDLFVFNIAANTPIFLNFGSFPMRLINQIRVAHNGAAAVVIKTSINYITGLLT